MRRFLSAVIASTGLTAATVLTSIVAAGPASAGACGGDTGPFLDVTSHRVIYHVIDGPFFDDNGTSHNATASYSNEYKKTVSSTVDASVEASISDVLASVKASVSASVTKSESVTIGHKITYTISPHTALHVEYAVRQVRVHLHRYHLNNGCVVFDSTWGYSNVDTGVGWHSWVTKD